jgi:hypothetical protein
VAFTSKPELSKIEFSNCSALAQISFISKVGIVP